MILSRISAEPLRALSFLLNVMHALRVGREPTVALIMQSPMLSPPLRWLLEKRGMFELFSRLSHLLGDWVDSLVFREFLIEVNGQKMFAIRSSPNLVEHSTGRILYPEDGMLMYTKGYESHVASHFCSLLREGTKVVDVGASLGYYTLLAVKRVGKSGEVLAFEPNPFRFKYLIKAIRINGWENVTAHKLFVSDFDSPEKNTVTLDSIVAGGADVVKIDVEGMELQVLRGMKRLLSKGVEVICEVHPKQLPSGGLRDISSFLRNHNYECHLITQQGLVQVAYLRKDERAHYFFSPHQAKITDSRSRLKSGNGGMYEERRGTLRSPLLLPSSDECSPPSDIPPTRPRRLVE